MSDSYLVVDTLPVLVTSTLPIRGQVWTWLVNKIGDKVSRERRSGDLRKFLKICSPDWLTGEKQSWYRVCAIEKPLASLYPKTQQLSNQCRHYRDRKHYILVEKLPNTEME